MDVQVQRAYAGCPFRSKQLIRLEDGRSMGGNVSVKGCEKLTALPYFIEVLSRCHAPSTRQGNHLLSTCLESALENIHACFRLVPNRAPSDDVASQRIDWNLMLLGLRDQAIK